MGSMPLDLLVWDERVGYNCEDNRVRRGDRYGT